MAPPRLLGRVGARMVDEDPSHGLSGDAEEVGAILPLHFPLIDELEERLVDEGCWLQRVVGALSP